MSFRLQLEVARKAIQNSPPPGDTVSLQRNYKTASKQQCGNKYICTIVTLNVNVLNSQIKTHRVIKGNSSIYCQKIHFRYKNPIRQKVKKWKELYHPINAGEKALDKIQHSCVIKNSLKSDHERKLPQDKKAI